MLQNLGGCTFTKRYGVGDYLTPTAPAVARGVTVGAIVVVNGDSFPAAAAVYKAVVRTEYRPCVPYRGVHALQRSV